jgi:predicted transcriptional regulator
MAMTLRLDPQLEAELRLVAEEDRRSVQQTVVLAVEAFLALRETAEVRADPEALRALAEARQAVQEGDVVYGADAARDLLRGRQAS